MLPLRKLESRDLFGQNSIWRVQLVNRREKPQTPNHALCYRPSIQHNPQISRGMVRESLSSFSRVTGSKSWDGDLGTDLEWIPLADLAKLFSEVGEEESFAQRLPTCPNCKTSQQATCIDRQLHLMPLSILAEPLLTLEVKKLSPLWDVRG